MISAAADLMCMFRRALPRRASASRIGSVTTVGGNVNTASDFGQGSSIVAVGSTVIFDH